MIRRTPLEWVEIVAGAGMWILIGVSSYLAATRPERMWVLAGCVMVLAVISAAAGIPRRLAGRRLWLRRGADLSGRAQEDDRPADDMVHRRRTLAVVSGLMPASAGRRWRAEADSVLTELPADRRRAAVRSYLLSAPRLAATMWTREVRRRARRGPRRPG